MSQFDVPITVRIPVEQFKVLRAIAVNSGVTPGELLAGMAARALPSPNRQRTPKFLTAKDRADIERLHAEGHADPSIAAELKLTRRTVRTYRDSIGLHGHEGRPRTTDTKGSKP